MKDFQSQDFPELYEVLVRVINYGYSHSMDETMQFFLDQAEILTGSSIAFFHFVKTDQENLHLQNWSTNTLASLCTLDPDLDRHYPIRQAGVWVECLHSRKAVIHNDYPSMPNKKGLPPGHAPVYRELVVPIIKNDSILAILGVGNKKDEYTEKDAALLQEFADTAWETVNRIRTLDQKERAEERLLHALKMESLGQIAGGIAHDFNNILTVLMGNLEILRYEKNFAEAHGEILQDMENSVIRAADLVKNILTFSSKQLHSPRILELNSELKELCRIYRHDLPVQIKLHLNSDSRPLHVHADRVQLQQLLNALLKNAEEALLRTPPLDDQPLIELSALQPLSTLPEDLEADSHNGTALYSGFSVHDNGPGIAKEILPMIFDPFFTTKGVGEGPGLGLATAYGIARQNHAHIIARSAPGQGCTVTVYWPMYTGNGI